jgi:hypothetical protein
VISDSSSYCFAGKILFCASVATPFHFNSLVTDPGFRRRFCLFHRTAPVLGFVYRRRRATGFTSTSSFRPSGGAAVFRDWLALDARHGRILFRVTHEPTLIVSDPVTGELRRLPFSVVIAHLPPLERGVALRRRGLRPPRSTAPREAPSL